MLSVGKKAKALAPVEDKQVQKAKGAKATDAAYYAFNSGDNGGFVIVAGDDLMPEIVGYSDKGAISADDMADGLKFYLQCYSEYVRQVRNGSITPHKAPLGDNTVIVEPLLMTAWNQTYPYNKYAPSCPVKLFGEKYNGTFPIGCVAVAVGQVMNYWQWPKAIDPKGDLFVGSKMLYDEDGKALGNHAVKDTLDLTKTAQPDYDWNNMTDNYLSYNNAEGVENYDVKAEAVGRFLRDVAYSLSMDWDEAGGGTLAQEGVFSKYFGYSKDCHHFYANLLPDGNRGEMWMNLIKENLENRQPIIYGGTSNSGGHCFVFDGLDSANRVHVNWGWGGSENGWFDITCLNTNMYDANDKGEYDFSFNAELTYNLHPNTEGKDESIAPLRTDILYHAIGYSNSIQTKPTEGVRIHSVMNPARQNYLTMVFRNPAWHSGMDMDYKYMFTAEDGTEKTMELKNTMTSEGISNEMNNALFGSKFLINDVFSYPEGTYQISWKYNIHNEKGDETGYDSPLTVDGSIPPLALIKEDDQCVLVAYANEYNPLYHDSKNTDEVKYWKNVYTSKNIENLVDGDSLVIVFDMDYPTTSLEPFDMNASPDCSITIKNRNTGEVVWKENVSKFEYMAYLMIKDEDSECGFWTSQIPIKPLSTGDYTMEVDYPLFKMVFTKDFTVKPNTTDIHSVAAATAGSKQLYNVAGQRVSDGYRGIVISNGKKEVRN